LEDGRKEGRNEGMKEGRMEGRKAKWAGHILHRNCLLKHVIEGNIEDRI